MRGDWDTLQVLAVNPEAMDQPTARLVVMAHSLCDAGDPTGAVRLLTGANERHPGDFWIHFELAYAHSQTKPAAVDERIRYCTSALALRPASPVAHNNLGVALAAKGRWDEAAAECRKALEIRPDFAEAHNNLGNALAAKGRWDEAVAERRKALQIRPDFAVAHYNLGNALYDKDRWDEAVAEYRKALQIRPDFAEAHIGLANALVGKSQFSDAFAEYRQALRIRPDLALPQRNLGIVLTLAERDLLLPIILRGEAGPADAAQQAAFADFCQRYKRLYAAASRLYAGAFAAEPPLAENLSSGTRYNAARAAALTGCGQGEDAATTDAKERGRWRKQALDWLRADLVLQTRQMSSFFAATRKNAADALQHWKEDPDLSGVRDADALAKLPPEERGAWRRLWADVDAALKKATK